ncbi:hypothetical protein GCM10009823_31840 [Brevibacterium salitolerans]|uniref:Thioredoxin domain-containing protein n=1 Tax=Brevibacterium salitolerans TaxID=1403566 RepID=A0ABP5IVF3_9MICO
MAFVPYAFTPVCSSELAELAALAPRLRAAGVRPVVVSCDTKYTLRAWAEQELGEDWDAVALLSDFWPHGRLAEALGVMDRARGGPHRTALLADASGTVTQVISADFGSRRDFSVLLSAAEGTEESWAEGEGQ